MGGGVYCLGIRGNWKSYDKDVEAAWSCTPIGDGNVATAVPTYARKKTLTVSSMYHEERGNGFVMSEDVGIVSKHGKHGIILNKLEN